MKALRIVAACSAAFGLLAAAQPAQAVTYGELDGDGHPYVGLLIFDQGGGPAWRCTGTLLAPRVVLTAGHCTYGAEAARIWFEADVSDRDATGYPYSGGTSIEAIDILTHPDYVPGAFFLHDLGVVILSEPVAMDEYGMLPPLDVLDGLATQRGLQNQLFNPVGYGLQSVKPVYQADRIRYTGDVMMIGIKGTAGIPEGSSVLFSNGPGQKATGGTCFGDSGGPIFWYGTNTIVAVTSFGLNQNCKGTGGGYRIDQADDQALIYEVLRVVGEAFPD